MLQSQQYQYFPLVLETISYSADPVSLFAFTAL